MEYVPPIPSESLLQLIPDTTHPQSTTTINCDHAHTTTQQPSSRQTLSGVCHATLPAPTGLKRPRTLAYPSVDDSKSLKHLKVSTPAGTSKQAASKRRILEQIRDGTFVRNPKRWETFKSKLRQLDPYFEVSENDPTLARSAKHSRCGSWILMAAPYDIERFKTHIKSCSSSYSTAAGGMKTLDNFVVFVCPKSAQLSSSSIPSNSESPPCPSRIALPCPGITEKDDSRIAQYVKRTSVNSAGGKDIHEIAKMLFQDQFKNLTSNKKDIVRQRQMQTHSWSVDRMRKSIHAIGNSPCSGNAWQAKDKTLRPCAQCLALLSLHAFRNAIAREPPKDENRVYVPHKFQPAEIGKLYGMGFNSLIDGVRYMYAHWH